MSENPIFILNGPNLNLLGSREPEIYGAQTLADIEKASSDAAQKLGFAIDFRQTNTEGTLVDWIQEAEARSAGLIINPGAYTHTSIALLDALTAISVAKIELHLSNIHAREPFRRRSLTAAGVDGVIMGLGAGGYLLAIAALKRIIDNQTTA